MRAAMNILLWSVLTGGLLAGCAERDAPAPDPQIVGELPADQFMASLRAYCGQAFEGEVVRDEGVEGEASIPERPLVMHVRECADDEIRIPFHAGENRSRTWIVTRTDEGLRLKHDHRHEDGSEETITMYGGDSLGEDHGTAVRQEFPADEHSRELFRREDIEVSMENVWALEVHPDGVFVYELARPGRLFRVAFDLTQPVDPPPPPWGAR